MGRIIHKFQDSTSTYPSGFEVLLDSREKVTIGNSSNGIKIYDHFLIIFPRLIWRCDNASFIEKSFPVLRTNFIGSPIEQIAVDIIKRFKTKDELINFLINVKHENK
ncbi:MAG: hypothetical protein WCW03_02580 [Candidatus Paceibacterota bacterium]|jgi:hypothetical protein